MRTARTRRGLGLNIEMASPEYLSAVLKALRFHGGSTHELEAIPENAWPALLNATDRAHLTLALGVRCRESLPQSVRLRIDRNLANNRARHDRLIATHRQIGHALSLYEIDYVVMKGLSQWPWYIDDPRQRPQYDIDIYVPRESMSAAAKTIHMLGYGFVGDILDPGADHLPVMIRKTGWTWRGDYYDPEMPPSVELHFRFWNPQMMRFDAGDLAQFWRRRVVRQVGSLRFPTLDPADGLTYSALHLIRHLLGGDLRLRHVYEIAHFLEKSASDDAFWSYWRETGLPGCRVVEGIAFRLASEWFHCTLHPAAREAVEELPSPVRRWFSLFAFSSALGNDHPEKHELWLHFCLVNSAKDRRHIAIRRLFPTRGARVVRDAHVPSSKIDPLLRVKRIAFEASFLARRILHHFRGIAPVIRGACLWFQADRKHSSGTAQP
jgi:hypothetical protein